MWKRLWLLTRRKTIGTQLPTQPIVALTEACVAALRPCMAPEIHHGREGIAYLLGLSDGTTTLAGSAIRPQAHTTRTSFTVASPSMAKVVRAAVRSGLHVVGQVHTHPGSAYHSHGDDRGAPIAHTGYISIVLPDYGRRLPLLDGAAAYVFGADGLFVPIELKRLHILPGHINDR